MNATPAPGNAGLCTHGCTHATHTLEKAPHKEGPGLCHLETTHGIMHLNMAFLSCIKAKTKAMCAAGKEFSILTAWQVGFFLFCFVLSQQGRVKG